MGAVWLLARGELRRRWGSLLGVGALVAIVSTGNLDEPLSLPAMTRVAGDSAIRVRPEVGGMPFAIDTAIELERRTMYAGAANPLGFGRSGSVES